MATNNTRILAGNNRKEELFFFFVFSTGIAELVEHLLGIAGGHLATMRYTYLRIKPIQAGLRDAFSWSELISLLRD